MDTFFKKAHHLGILFVIWFVICFAWFYVQPVERVLHVRLLRLSFFYFSDMNLMSMLSGAVQAYLWGYIGVATWVLACKIACIKK